MPSSERALWQANVAALISGASSSPALLEAMEQRKAWVMAIATSTGVVVDQNMPPLVAHLRTIIKDGVAASVRSLHARAISGASTPDEASAVPKAKGVMSTLVAAVDNVQQQFIVGLRSVSPVIAAQLGKGLLNNLCKVHHRVGPFVFFSACLAFSPVYHSPFLAPLPSPTETSLLAMLSCPFLALCR